MTILSGDIDSDDTLDGDNSYHVVNGTGAFSTAILDGFTITMGYAIGDYNPGDEPVEGYSPNGGGLVVCDEIVEDEFPGHGSPTIRNCIFMNNQAERGGAVYNFQGDTTFEDCKFLSNIANLHSGAVYSDGGASTHPRRGDATFLRCTFLGNRAMDDSVHMTGGGAVHAGNCAPRFESCEFDSNWAGDDDGLANSRGGAIYSTCEPAGAIGGTNGTIIVNCLFKENRASVEGGAIFLDCEPPRRPD